jgi:pimeloyl-ACP methyl ester carboxylesterase
MATTTPPTTFSIRRLNVNGAEIAMLTAGSGDPLLFLHGAGTLTGFEFALGWADQFQVLIPYHPGFGESADDPRVREMHDYVLHYLELLDQLGLARVNLVGQSLGGWLAARFAIEHGHRVRRLVLCCPAGLRVPEHPTLDVFTIPPEQLLARLIADQNLLQRLSSQPPSIDAVIGQYREQTSLARVIWDRNYDVTLERWLHRASMPCLLLWGQADQVVPVEQARVWAGRLPNARVEVLPGAGHLLFHETPRAVQAVREFLAQPD